MTSSPLSAIVSAQAGAPATAVSVGDGLAPVIVFANHSGGSNKSTTSTAQAGEAARRGLRTLVLDFNYQGDASHVLGFPLPDNICIRCEMTFGVTENDDDDEPCAQTTDGRHEAMETVFESLLDEDNYPIEGAIHPAVDRNGTIVPNLWIAVASEQLSTVEPKLVNVEGYENVIVRLLRKVRRQYDVIIIDAPGAYGPLLRALYVAATHVVACVKPTLKEIKHLVRMLKTIGIINDRLRPDTPVTLDAIVIGDVFPASQGRAYADMVAIVRKRYGDLVTRTVRHSVLVPEAFSRRTLLTMYVPDAPISKDYTNVYDDLCERGVLPRGNPDGVVDVETIDPTEIQEAAAVA